MLSKLQSPHVIKLYSTFQDKKKLYFVLDYAINGDFEGFLQRQCKRKLTNICGKTSIQVSLVLYRLDRQNY